MGKSAPRAPAPVDPTALSNAQTQSNLATAREQQRLNMTGTEGPGGSVRFVADPGSPSGYRQVTSLSQGQQGLYDLGQAAQTGALGIANEQLGRIGDTLGQGLNAPTLQTSVGPTDFTADREAITDTVFGRARSRLDPMFADAESRERTRLANQGLGENSTAYGTAIDRFNRGKSDAYDQALSSAILAGADEQTNLFNQRMAQANFGNQAQQQGFQNQAFARSQPINDFSALLGMGNIVMPEGYGGPVAGVAPTDVLGAYGLSEQGRWNAYNARANNVNSRNRGVTDILAAAFGG